MNLEHLVVPESKEELKQLDRARPPPQGERVLQGAQGSGEYRGVLSKQSFRKEGG